MTLPPSGVRSNSLGFIAYYPKKRDRNKSFKCYYNERKCCQNRQKDYDKVIIAFMFQSSRHFHAVEIDIQK